MDRDQKTVQPRASENERTPNGPHADQENTEDCRCKATSEMKPRELLRLMMSDLLLWKRPGKK
jgi:hypothetical protein